jgi:hypothetical protein
MTMTATHTRTHTLVRFANPYLRCVDCWAPVTGYRPGPNGYSVPCGHDVATVPTCPSWGPVDGCTCTPVCPVPREE